MMGERVEKTPGQKADLRLLTWLPDPGSLRLSSLLSLQFLSTCAADAPALLKILISSMSGRPTMSGIGHGFLGWGPA